MIFKLTVKLLLGAVCFALLYIILYKPEMWQQITHRSSPITTTKSNTSFSSTDEITWQSDKKVMKAGKLYKWQDQQGQWHYANTPPEASKTMPND